MSHAQELVVEQIRRGDAEAWGRVIADYEGRLLAYVQNRLRDRSAAEDVVQETFIGFLTSLPNYDTRRPLESWLFTIAAHKLTDYLRREGRRPALPFSSSDGSGGPWEVPGNDRAASSVARSGERQRIEESAIAEAIAGEIGRWRERGDWTKLKCIELLVSAGLGNKEVAQSLGISEQQVANFKFDFLARLRTLVRRQDLSEDVFPELYESPA